MADGLEMLRTLLADGDSGVLVTLKRDGRPQLSNVNYAYDDASRTIRVSITDGRAKTANLRRDARAAFHVTTPDRSGYVVADATAELTPVAADLHDPVVEELIDLFRAVQGEHPDWDDYRAAMVRDRRLIAKLRVDHLYGWSPQAGQVSTSL